jgi:folate-binding protein YgfZ
LNIFSNALFSLVFMETTVDIKAEHKKVREHCGFFPLDSWSLVQASGTDIFTFLQSQTTNDILQLSMGQGQNSAIVDRKARLIAPFSIHRNGEHSVVFLLESQIREKFIKHLTTYLFREDVKVEPLTHSLLALQGPKSAMILENRVQGIQLPEKQNSIVTFDYQGNQVLAINKSLTGEEGYILACDSSLREKYIAEFEKADGKLAPVPVNPETFEVLRVEAGIPLFNKDMDEKNILPETGLEHSSVNYNKGCYIGQEVIARIKTYGAPSVALMGLIFEGDCLPPHDGIIKLNNKKIGTLKSAVFSPSLEKNIALAYLQKEHRSPDIEMEITINDQPYKVKTNLLPFYQPQTRKDHSKRLMDQALQIYKDEEDLEKPISLLREAIALDPKHANAYEALGVFLSNQGKLDEAIALMKRLVEIDPTEIMAHSNLSVYYMKQGRIEEAELEKGEATAIEFERLVAQNLDKKKKEKREAADKKERERMVGMFEQVLEIDPVDQVANFGLGSIYLETGQYEKALPPLRIVIQENKDYSAAYLLLGKNLEKLSRNEEAIEVYRQGIAAASKKGDLMPLKDMQSRLNQLLHSSEG